jgi:hypothetical protein
MVLLNSDFEFFAPRIRVRSIFLQEYGSWYISSKDNPKNVSQNHTVISKKNRHTMIIIKTAFLDSMTQVILKTIPYCTVTSLACFWINGSKGRIRMCAKISRTLLKSLLIGFTANQSCLCWCLLLVTLVMHERSNNFRSVANTDRYRFFVGTIGTLLKGTVPWNPWIFPIKQSHLGPIFQKIASNFQKVYDKIGWLAVIMVTLIY